MNYYSAPRSPLLQIPQQRRKRPNFPVLSSFLFVICGFSLFYYLSVTTRFFMLKKEEVIQQENIHLFLSTGKFQVPTSSSQTARVLQTNLQLQEERQPRHVLFFSQRNYKEEEDDRNRLDRVIARNTIFSLRALESERTIILPFDQDDVRIGKNEFGFPILRDMFMLATSLIPEADTYTYLNSDLIFNQSFVDTMDAIVKAAWEGKISNKFMVVGFRTNVRWEPFMKLETTRNFTNLLHSGVKFQSDAQDYFTCSKFLWNWEKDIPPFVIGRIAYDNWLLHQVVTSRTLLAIDGTNTNPVIHQTGKAGNFQGHYGTKANKEYNILLAKGTSWRAGKISRCPMETRWGESGKVVLVKRY